MTFRRVRWESKSGFYHGSRVYTERGKFIGLELSEDSQLLLAHENCLRNRKLLRNKEDN